MWQTIIVFVTLDHSSRV